MEVAPLGVPLTSKPRIAFCGECARCMGSHHLVGDGAGRLPLSMRIDALQASAIYRVTDCRARADAFPSRGSATPRFRNDGCQCAWYCHVDLELGGARKTAYQSFRLHSGIPTV